MKSPRHVLILECALSGHHSVYLERIASGFLDNGDEVTVTTLRRDLGSTCIDRLRTKYGKQVSIFVIEDAEYDAAFGTWMGEAGRELALRQLFGRVYRHVYDLRLVDYVFLPYVDYCLHALGALGSPFGKTEWGGICMRPSFHYAHFDVIAPAPKLARIKQSLLLRLLRVRSLQMLFTIDELLEQYVAQRNSSLASRIRYVPDPAELVGSHTRASARQHLGIPFNARVILCYGAIDERKGLDVLVNALNLPGAPSDISLLVVGKQSQWAKCLLSSSTSKSLIEQCRLHVVDAFVDDELQQAVFVASDAVWLGYKAHYSMSGVLVLSTLARKPVIATREGLIGWHTRKNRLGVVIDVSCIETVIEALKTLSSGRLNEPGLPQEWDRYWSWAGMIERLMRKRPC